MKTPNEIFPVEKFRNLPTPFYYYDLKVLRDTLDALKKESLKYNFRIHYAVKSNANPRLLRIISSYGFGADCVSWNEIKRALENGFRTEEIVFAGVGKSDHEIEKALNEDIYCFNCESLQELEVINSIALKADRKARVALRINPFVEAHTHKHITTGIEESKFGIVMADMEAVLSGLSRLKKLELIGIHFHIGSQINRMQVFKNLCNRIIEIREWFSARNIELKVINAGGGLGIDYENPSNLPLFGEYFQIFNEMIAPRKGQEIHFEPGRSISGQCGTLISRVLYVKNGGETQFVIIDAGMTDLIRPALYQAYHMISNLTSWSGGSHYDIVGPVCESSDTFGKYVELPVTSRGDLIAIRSAGAYGEVMASRYNLRDLPGVIFSDDI